MIIVSACLLGHCTKYNGGSNIMPLLMKYHESSVFIPYCPEVAGGLRIPRDPAEIQAGSGADVLAGKARIMSNKGNDVTKYFISGAEKMAVLTTKYKITAAILKQRSPSCGTTHIYDGSYSNKIRTGQGVAAALLKQLRIPLYSEEDINIELLESLIEADKR